MNPIGNADTPIFRNHFMNPLSEVPKLWLIPKSYFILWLFQSQGATERGSVRRSNKISVSVFWFIAFRLGVRSCRIYNILAWPHNFDISLSTNDLFYDEFSFSFFCQIFLFVQVNCWIIGPNKIWCSRNIITLLGECLYCSIYYTWRRYQMKVPNGWKKTTPNFSLTKRTNRGRKTIHLIKILFTMKSKCGT